MNTLKQIYFYRKVTSSWFCILLFLLKTISLTFPPLSLFISVSIDVCAQQLQSCPTLWDPWTVAHQALLSMEFSRKVYWSGLPFPLPGDLPDPGIKPISLTSPALAGRFFTTSTTWEYTHTHTHTWLSHFAIHLKLVQHCKVTILQLKKFAIEKGEF